MSHAKAEIIDGLNQIHDEIEDEFQVMDDLYKLLKLKRSQRSVEEEGTLTTDQVREHFKERREGMALQC